MNSSRHQNVDLGMLNTDRISESQHGRKEMNLKPSQKLYLSVGITLVLLAVVWLVSTAVAQAPGSSAPQAPAGGSYANTFSYQGRLVENGEPVSGTYDFIVTIWDGGVTQIATCLTSTTEGVLIENGVFTLFLIPDRPMNEVFSGQERWIELAVSPAGMHTYTTLDRQPIAPTPYAWGLRSGAVISGTADATTSVLQITGTVASDSAMLEVVGAGDGAAVRGISTSGTGVLGSSTSSIGVMGSSTSGRGVVAFSGSGNLIEAWDWQPTYELQFSVDNAGNIYSAAETQLAINPFEIEATSELANNLTLDFLHHWEGYTEIENASNTGSSTIYVPVHNVTELYGRPLKLEELRVCYELDTASSYIDQTKVYYANISGGRTAILTDTVKRTSTTWTCYNVSTTPAEVRGPLLIYFSLDFAGTGSGHTISIGHMAATLVE
jgi:hypothetical protein